MRQRDFLAIAGHQRQQPWRPWIRAAPGGGHAQVRASADGRQEVRRRHDGGQFQARPERVHRPVLHQRPVGGSGVKGHRFAHENLVVGGDNGLPDQAFERGQPARHPPRADHVGGPQVQRLRG